MSEIAITKPRRHRSALDVPYWLCLPAFLLFTGFVIFPAVSSFYYSLTSWDGLNKTMEFIGLRNYADMFRDKRFYNAFKNTIILTVALTLLENVTALGLALLVDRVKVAKTVFRSVFYIPVLLSGIVSGYIWVALLNYTFGVVNHVLGDLGLKFLMIDWLGNPRFTLGTVIAVMVWKSSGYYMIIYLAGIANIPKDLLEASSIDGASGWAQLRKIVLPLLAGTFTINLTLSLINGLRVFDQIVAMTSGGPGFATETFTYQIYSVAFAEGRQGYGTALAIILFAVTLVFATLQNIVLRRREVQA
jgi:multiple sugar transport system permease protein/raffinose/stachyose/melibiose transport system permease protein